jgi:hypothetical protein
MGKVNHRRRYPQRRRSMHVLISCAGAIGKLKVGGSMIAGTDANDDLFVSADSVAKIQVKGSVLGTASDHVVINLGASPPKSLALGSLTVGGDFMNASLLTGTTIHSGSQVGSIYIGGDFIASRIALSTTPGQDGTRGTADDGSLDTDSQVLSRIASLTIKGQALGTIGGKDSYRITASEFGKVKIGGNTIALTDTSPGAHNKFIGPTGDLAIRYGVPVAI